jgi:hypothetical protein
MPARCAQHCLYLDTSSVISCSGWPALLPSQILHLLGVQVRVELYDTRRTKFISAHDSALASLTLCSNGKLLATASEKGTLVRLLACLALAWCTNELSAVSPANSCQHLHV